MSSTASLPAEWSWARRRAAPLLLAAWVATGCASSLAGSDLATAAGGPNTVWVVHHGWHVGLALRRADLAPGAWPEADDLAPTRFLEVGWGDGTFYPASPGTTAMALRAAFFSRSSVLQVVGFDPPPAVFFGGRPVVEVLVSARGFQALIHFVRQTYATGSSRAPVRLTPALYGSGWFYLARGRYHVFGNSNSWAARALDAAGCPGTPRCALTADRVLEQARRCARPVPAA